MLQVLITDESVKVYRRVEELLPELRRLAAYRMGNEEAEQVVTILQEIIRSVYYNRSFKL
jgi:DNA-binding MarR family transcriptional regulator